MSRISSSRRRSKKKASPLLAGLLISQADCAYFQRLFEIPSIENVHWERWDAGSNPLSILAYIRHVMHILGEGITSYSRIPRQLSAIGNQPFTLIKNSGGTVILYTILHIMYI